ncbi:hypothetical protein GZL_07924 [Streptomyces sp. 769]|nr:hypothetical protein GZL_07924 [Streptomyces sp. 769]
MGRAGALILFQRGQRSRGTTVSWAKSYHPELAETFRCRAECET